MNIVFYALPVLLVCAGIFIYLRRIGTLEPVPESVYLEALSEESWKETREIAKAVRRVSWKYRPTSAEVNRKLRELAKYQIIEESEHLTKDGLMWQFRKFPPVQVEYGHHDKIGRVAPYKSWKAAHK